MRGCFLSIFVLTACGGGAPDVRNAPPTPPVPDAAPELTVDRPDQRCECGPNEQCRSAEEESWNFCGAPREPRCAAGQVGDSCGHCFVGCAGDADCAGGMTCNGSYCISARRCVVPRPPPP